MRLKKMCLLLLTFLALHSNINANCSSCDCTCWWNDIWVDVEFLYWKPCLSDARVAATSTIPASTGEVHDHFLRFDWEPGVRATIGKDNLLCGLNLLGSYTYIRPDGKVDLSASGGSFIFSDFLAANYGPAVADFGYSASIALFQRHKITYQTWEVLLSRPFVTPCLGFNPYFGVEGLVLDQSLNVSITSIEGNSANFDVTLDFNGAGLKAGMEVLYPLCGCIDLFVNPSFSIVCGNKRRTVRGNGVTNDDTPLPLHFVEKGSACVFLPTFDIQVGLSYAATCCNKLMGVKIGWEFLQWSNVPQINLLDTIKDKLTLGFQGLTVGGFLVF